MQGFRQRQAARQDAPLLYDLRAATATAHRRLESRHAFSAPGFGRSDYETVLRACYGFYAPLERLLQPFACAIPNLDWDKRIKAQLLERDLCCLGYAGVSIERIPQCVPLPDIQCMADALGCLYVIEGATLGGQVLLRRVRLALGLTTSTGAAFFSGYGEHTGAMWRQFTDCLNLLERPEERTRACLSAQFTFETFESWLDACGGLRTGEEVTHG